MNGPGQRRDAGPVGEKTGELPGVRRHKKQRSFCAFLFAHAARRLLLMSSNHFTASTSAVEAGCGV